MPSESRASPVPSRSDPDLARICALNDALRQDGTGGRIMLTSGVAALGASKVALITEAVSRFAAFTPDNDPHREHDFGSLRVAGETIMFKIDYFDRDMRMHSLDPADADMTCRVMTIMLAGEYFSSSRTTSRRQANRDPSRQRATPIAEASRYHYGGRPPRRSPARRCSLSCSNLNGLMDTNTADEKSG